MCISRARQVFLCTVVAPSGSDKLIYEAHAVPNSKEATSENQLFINYFMRGRQLSLEVHYSDEERTYIHDITCRIQTMHNFGGHG